MIPASYGGIVDGQYDPNYLLAPASWTDVTPPPWSPEAVATPKLDSVSNVLRSKTYDNLLSFNSSDVSDGWLQNAEREAALSGKDPKSTYVDAVSNEIQGGHTEKKCFAPTWLKGTI